MRSKKEIIEMISIIEEKKREAIQKRAESLKDTGSLLHIIYDVDIDSANIKLNILSWVLNGDKNDRKDEKD